jgi:hypothetical protein
MMELAKVREVKFKEAKERMRTHLKTHKARILMEEQLTSQELFHFCETTPITSGRNSPYPNKPSIRIETTEDNFEKRKELLKKQIENECSDLTMKSASKEEKAFQVFKKMLLHNVFNLQPGSKLKLSDIFFKVKLHWKAELIEILDLLLVKDLEETQNLGI